MSRSTTIGEKVVCRAVVSGVALLGALSPATVRGATVTFEFEGQISESVSTQVSVRDRFVGLITYDTDAEDLALESDVGSYEYPWPSAAPSGMTYTVGSLSYSTNTLLELLIFDNSFTFDDWILFTSDSFADPSPPQRGAILLEDITQAAISSDRPPMRVNLADFTDAVFSGVDADGSSFSGRIDAIRFVPEPRADLLMLASFLLLGAFRIRKARACRKPCHRLRFEPLEDRRVLSFLAPTIYPGDALGGLAAADLNNDGVLDLVVAESYRLNDDFKTISRVSLHLGTGDGAFQPASPFADLAPNLRDLAIGDFDGDGNLDMVTSHVNADFVGGHLSILLGNGDGTSAPAVEFSLPAVATQGKKANGKGSPAPQAPDTVVVGDLNADGLLDLVVRGDGPPLGGYSEPAPTNAYVNVLLGQGDGTFRAVSTQALGQSSPFFNTTTTLGDFNGDGAIDVLTSEHTLTTNTTKSKGKTTTNVEASQKIFILLGRGDGSLGSASVVTEGAGGIFASGDLNSDGRLDFVTVRSQLIDPNADPQQYSHTATVFLGIGNGRFQAAGVYEIGEYPHAVAIVDVDRDGRLDILTSNTGSDDISVLLGHGDATFQVAQHFAAAYAPGGLAIGDFDGDAFLDVATATTTSPPGVFFVRDAVSVLINDADWPVPTNLVFASHAEKSAPNDKRLNQQWALQVTEAERAWDFATGSTQIIAAANGHLVVASAMNNSTDNDVLPRLPASFDLPNIISVTATDKHDRLAKFSNFGADSVDLGAPGVNVLTTELGGKYAIVDGTSFAAPHVAGAAALILSINPDLNFAQLKSLILDNVDPLPGLAGQTVTGGRLNIFEAVSATPIPF